MNAKFERRSEHCRKKIMLKTGSSTGKKQSCFGAWTRMSLLRIPPLIAAAIAAHLISTPPNAQASDEDRKRAETQSSRDAMRPMLAWIPLVAKVRVSY